MCSIYIFVYIFHENYSFSVIHSIHFTNGTEEKKKTRNASTHTHTHSKDVCTWMLRYGMAYTMCCLWMRWTNWKRVKCVYDRYDGACKCFSKWNKHTKEKKRGQVFSNVNVIRVIFMLFHLIEPFNYHFTKVQKTNEKVKRWWNNSSSSSSIDMNHTFWQYTLDFSLKEQPAVNVNSTERKKIQRRNEAKGSWLHELLAVLVWLIVGITFSVLNSWDAERGFGPVNPWPNSWWW